MTLVEHAGLAPSRRVLRDDLVVTIKENRTIPAVTLNAAFQAGSVHEPAHLPGLAFFLSRVLDRGTTTRSGEAIADDLDSRGVTLAVGVNRHVLSVVCTVLAEDFEPVLELIADIAQHATLPADEVEIRRGEIATLIQQDDDNPAAVAVDALLRLVYPDGHPYGRNVKGTRDSVQLVQRADLERFYQARVERGPLSLVVVGDVDESRVLQVTRRVFDSRPASAPESGLRVPPIPIPRTRRRVILPMMNKAQADVAYGFPGPRRLDPEYYAYWVMNNILGQYGLGGRLGDKIRERDGMAYYVFSAMEANVDRGVLMIRAGIAPANVERAIAAIDEEVAALAENGATERELAETKQHLIASLPRMLETNAAVANFLQTAEFFGLGTDYDLRLPALLRAVTLDDAHRAARAVLSPDRAAVAIAGPYGG
jgi:zinc protease